MADISKISLNGGEYNVRDKVAVLRGTGAPSTATVGTVGALYEDITNGDLYICKTVSGSSYVWEKKSQVTVTNADPGEGASLNAGEFLAVYGAGAYVDVADVIWVGFLNKIYPVGSIYISTTLTTAAAVGNALGGTWVAWGAGRVPVGVDTTQTEFSTVEKTGGEKTHKLTVNEMPSHSHYDGTDGSNGISASSGGTSACVYWQASTGRPTTSTGGDQAHNNLQPYITCYFWKRTA